MVYYVLGPLQTLYKYELSLTVETNNIMHILQMKRLRFREIYLSVAQASF